MSSKRSYHSETRDAQAAATKNNILESAKKLFQSKGFAGVTIEMIAEGAKVSKPSVYAIFKSKKGILRALMDEALPPGEFTHLVEEVKQAPSEEERMGKTAKLCRKIYDAEREMMDIISTAAAIAPEFRTFEKEREERRYHRQKAFVHAPTNEKALDLLWAFTGRDLYRMLVIDRGWSPAEYEKWLADQLIKTVLAPPL